MEVLRQLRDFPCSMICGNWENYYLPPLLDYAYQKAEEAGYVGLPFVPDDIWDEATRTFEQSNYPKL